MKPSCQQIGKGFLAFCVLLAILVIGWAYAHAQSLIISPIGKPEVRIGNNIRLIQVGDNQRSYIFHIPPSYDVSNPIPVVLVIHGAGTNAYGFSNITGFNQQSDESGFITVYPNGLSENGDNLLTWNAGDCCGYAEAVNSDDVQFIRLILDDLESILNIDPQRIFATGMSNGAMFVFRLACELSDRITAIAPVSGTQHVSGCTPTRPISVLGIYGTSDPHAPLDRSALPADNVKKSLTVFESIDFWVIQNECPDEPDLEYPGQNIHKKYRPCSQNTSVELYLISHGGHSWPTSVTINLAPDGALFYQLVTGFIWNFFESHSQR